MGLRLGSLGLGDLWDPQIPQAQTPQVQTQKLFDSFDIPSPPNNRQHVCY